MPHYAAMQQLDWCTAAMQPDGSFAPLKAQLKLRVRTFSGGIAASRRFEAPDDPRGIAGNNGKIWNRLRHDRARADDAAPADRDPRKHDRVVSDPNILADHDGLGSHASVPRLRAFTHQLIEIGAPLVR